MQKQGMKTYEAMFLLDTGSRDFDAATEPVRVVLARIKAETLSMKPWDERRLCYPIKGRKRGLYVLTYFKADPANMAELQHEIQLNERILRALLLSADHLSEEKTHAETPATLSWARRAAADAQKAARAKAKAEEESGKPPAQGKPKAAGPIQPITPDDKEAAKIETPAKKDSSNPDDQT